MSTHMQLAERFRDYTGEGARLYTATIRTPRGSTWAQTVTFARRHDDEQTARDYARYIYPDGEIVDVAVSP